MQRTLGGDRLGTGKKMKVELHGYERSTHDLGYLWRSTMSVGTLVPFLNEVGLPGDTFDINLDCNIMTHPTVGPLFGSMKVQLDVFTAPVRLYQGSLHNNKVGIGLKMQNVKLPVMMLHAKQRPANPNDIDNLQVNPSSLLSYLGVRGVGNTPVGEAGTIYDREFNGLSLLSYWDIYKNYYANKQETPLGSLDARGAMIYNPNQALVETVDNVSIDGTNLPTPTLVTSPVVVVISYTGARPVLSQIILNTDQGNISMNYAAVIISETAGVINLQWRYYITGNINVINWAYITPGELPYQQPQVVQFPLSSIDDMREAILHEAANPAEFVINTFMSPEDPFWNVLSWGDDDLSPYLGTQNGLALKTYQSDLFNNWLSTEYIDGAGGINDITSIDTSGGSFTIDTLQLQKKIYDMLNRIAVSGGTYDDWLDSVYTENRFSKPETPVYHGGLIKELVFQTVVSNSESSGQTGNVQPLGTLAGRGQLSQKHKGGQIHIKIDEPCYIMGIVSITPRVDYSQGNKWDTGLKTMDDFHKPALDEIGFQELDAEQMAWWATNWNAGTSTWDKKSAGKQPAWINYMTNVNQVRGNFAIQDNEMFMTLNRRYEEESGAITDLTTYIDPSKFNFIFAQTSLDAMNYWTQIAVDITARRKMSAKLMPNL